MNTMTVAVPSAGPGGVDAPVDAHFGHCDCYTLVDVEDGRAKDARVLPSIPHVQGGCMGPVNYLAENGVNLLISGGMGMRPLMGFDQVGITVYHCGVAGTVSEAVGALLRGELNRFTPGQTCGGGSDAGCGGH